MIIWGSCGKEIVVAQGQFFCPACDDRQHYLHKRVAKYFTLYFIPLFQTANLGEFVECTRCRRQFTLEALRYRPPSPGERLAVAARAELDAGLPLHMLVQKLMAQGIDEETSRRIAQVAAGDHLLVCVGCKNQYRHTVQNCFNCGGRLVVAPVVVSDP